MSPALRERLQQGLRVADDLVYPVDGDARPRGRRRADEARPARPQGRPVGAARAAVAREPRGGRACSRLIRAGDVLVHHPYDSFAASFESFAHESANDPDVIALKSTVYRTNDESPLVPALIEASENGKQTVCLVELKARGDERRNIEWSRAMEQAGVHVAYGFSSLKIHAKMTMVVRREPGGLRRYVHIGTGNYNSVTARGVRGLRPLHRRRGHRRRRRRPLQLRHRASAGRRTSASSSSRRSRCGSGSSRRSAPSPTRRAPGERRASASR